MFDHLTSEARQIVEALYGLSEVDCVWERPREAGFGDLSSSVALRLGKQLGKKPTDIAKAIAEKMMDSPSVEKAEVAGPGFVNLWLTSAALIDELEKSRTHHKPLKKQKKSAPIIVDYSGPNIAKPLGIHHILSTVIGQSIVNVYQHAGYETVSWNYLGDWGTQFGKLAIAYQNWGTSKPASAYTLDELLALYVKFHDEAEKNPELEEKARAVFHALETGDKELKSFWEEVVHITTQSLGSIYEKLQVSFDVQKGESAYEGKMEPIVEEGKKKNVFTTGEKGALIAQFSEESGMPPAVIVKADGSTLYHTRDLALMKDRMDGWKPQKILYVVDIAQALHFKQLFAIAEQLEWDTPELEHIAFGRMRFADGSMSTRKGNILKLEHVLEEAVKRAEAIIKERGESIQTDDPQDLAEMMGVGALVYGILSQNRKMDMIFDWEKMLSFEGNSAPYLQYTHARARSVLRKAKAGKEVALPTEVPTLDGHDRNLLSTLLQFGNVLVDTRTEHLPHKLANYLFELCQTFNAFYNSAPILNAEDDVRPLRLSLTSFTADVLRTGATLLTIRVPDRM